MKSVSREFMTLIQEHGSKRAKLDALSTETLRVRHAECKALTLSFAGHPSVTDGILDTANLIKEIVDSRGERL